MTAPLTPLLASQPVEALLVRLLAQIGLMLLDQDAQDCWVLLEHGLSFQDGSAALVRPGLVVARRLGAASAHGELACAGGVAGVSSGHRAGADGARGRAEGRARVERGIDHRAPPSGSSVVDWRTS